jgi:diguanylate cyclase
MADVARLLLDVLVPTTRRAYRSRLAQVPKHAVDEGRVPYRTALRWLRADANWLLPAAAAVSAPVLVAGLLVGPDTLRAISNLSGAALMAMGAVTLWRVGRLPGLPRADRRLWFSIVATLGCYGLGMIVDLAVAVSHAVLGTPTVGLAVGVIYPLAGLLSVVAMFQYPTTARTLGERVTVGMDANIVLLSSGVFIWYFSLSRHWEPSDGWIALLGTLVQPLLTLVAGFAMLKIAFVGANVISRPTLVCFAGCVVGSAATVGLASMGGRRQFVILAVGAVISEFLVTIGCQLQYKVSVVGRERPPPGQSRRRVLSFLPYVASAAAFLLLVALLRPVLDWRQWGVLSGIGLLLAAVSARQALSLRENRRLLAHNRQLTVQLRRQAWFDELTGLANRAHYGDSLRGALDRARSGGTRTALLLIDLDDFKIVNDTLGHAAGDALLRVVARRLTDQVRGSDTVCRLGGDEFVVIAEDADETGAQLLADRLIQSLIEPVQISEHTVTVGASIGVTLTDGGTTPDPDALLRDADVALYAAKAGAKGGWRLAGQIDAAGPMPLAPASRS